MRVNPIKLTEHEGFRIIPIEYFNECLEDGATRSEISAYTKNPEGKTMFYLVKFERYILNKFSLNIKEYCKKFFNFDWPKCPASNEDVGYKMASGKGVVIRHFKHHASVTQDLSPKFKAFVDKMKVDRLGDGNPMHGKTPWNEGLNKESSESIRLMAEKNMGRITSEESKLKQSESAKKRKVHGHTGHKHSDESKAKMREETAKRYSDGTFKRKTSIEKKIEDILSGLKFKSPWESQFLAKYYSIDFAFPELKIAIEADGDYFHINPEFFPEGPKSSVQKRNAGRDKAKNTYLTARGWPSGS